jgi:hypothetical protein
MLRQLSLTRHSQNADISWIQVNSRGQILVTDEYWNFKTTISECSSIYNGRLEKLPDQCYIRVTANTSAFAQVMLPLLYQPFECGSFCDLVKSFIGMDMDLAKTEEKINLIYLFSKTLGTIMKVTKQDATIHVNLLFLVSCTCFGRCFRPSSGVVLTVSGSIHPSCCRLVSWMSWKFSFQLISHSCILLVTFIIVSRCTDLLSSTLETIRHLGK